MPMDADASTCAAKHVNKVQAVSAAAPQVPQTKAYIHLGEAICLLLKFLKHSNVIYFFLSLLALTACVVCFMVAV
jgi:hypothetical protein